MINDFHRFFFLFLLLYTCVLIIIIIIEKIAFPIMIFQLSMLIEK